MSRPTTLQRPPWVTRFATRDGLLLYHDFTGRVLRLRGAGLDAWRAFASGPRDPATVEPASAVEALARGGFLIPPEAQPWAIIEQRAPIRGRWATWYDGPEQVHLAERALGTPETPYHIRALEPVEAFLWRRATGYATTGQLIAVAATHFGRALAERGLKALLRWTSGQLQLVKLLDGPLDPGEADPILPPHFFGYVDQLPLTDSDDPTGAVDLDDYHRRVITDADAQFDFRETTVSHLLRVPTPVLDGSTYGARLVARLGERGALPPGARVLEVGGGTGWLARRALEARPDLRWTIVDLSPALLRAQRQRLAGRGVRFVHADGMRLPIADGAVDVLVSNEVIADLPAARVDPAGEVPAIVRRLEVVPDAPRVTNVGALRFVAEVGRVLRPGGLAWISEYGDLDREPVEAVHLDHPEVGIEFSVLKRGAERLGLGAEVVRVMDDLRFTDAPALAAPPAQFAALRALLPALGGRPPEKRACTPDDFAALCGDGIEPGRVQALAFAGARTRLMTFPTPRVRALVLRKPG